MNITINPPKQVTVTPSVPAVTTEVSEVEIITISDNTVDCVTAVISVNGFQKVLVLWEGQAYTDIGNWTQQQANDRIVELLN